MSLHQRQFPSRFIDDGGDFHSDGESLSEQSPRPGTINQHLAGTGEPMRAMTSEETERILRDPFGGQVLRQGIFPANLTELLAALDKISGAAAIPKQESFALAEAGQIPFLPGQDRGSVRMITVRSRGGAPQVLINTLIPTGVNPRSETLLLEVIGWDPDNMTMHFYQRQEGMWFWCGQSDMALVEPTRGHGPFDSHVNGYVVMKELRSPWIHWHGPDLQLSETAFSHDDPVLADPLFQNKSGADTFEVAVIRPLADRWNQARFEKRVESGRITRLSQWTRQAVTTTTVNLRSARQLWSEVTAGTVQTITIPSTFFFDSDGLATCGLNVRVPTLSMSAQRYVALVQTYDLRVTSGEPRGDGLTPIDQAGDVPFCFLVPERALEDTLAAAILVDNGVLSQRLLACLLMVDFPNPVFSECRAALLGLLPDDSATSGMVKVEEHAINAARSHQAAAPTDDPVVEFLRNWALGEQGWKSTFETRLEDYLGRVSARLKTDEGTDDYFRLAESRRRQFRARPLAEFDLTLPRAQALVESPPLMLDPSGLLK